MACDPQRLGSRDRRRRHSQAAGPGRGDNIQGLRPLELGLQRHCVLGRRRRPLGGYSERRKEARQFSSACVQAFFEFHFRKRISPMTTKKNGAAQRVTLPTSEHRIPVGSTALKQTSSGKWIELTIGVKPVKALPDLSALDEKLPAQRKYMTREQLAHEYGSDPKAVQAIESFAKEHDLVVTRNEPASARMGLAGTADKVNAAFGVTLTDFENPKLGAFHARTSPVTLPPEVGDAITGVFGLNNHRICNAASARRTISRRDGDDRIRPWFIPTELAAVYNFPNANAQQQCIGLLEFGGGVEPSTLRPISARSGARAQHSVVAVDGVARIPHRPRFDRRGDARRGHRRCASGQGPSSRSTSRPSMRKAWSTASAR